MNYNTCKTCKFFVDVDGERKDFGDCYSDKFENDVVCPLDCEARIVSSDFGCIHWASKP